MSKRTPTHADLQLQHLSNDMFGTKKNKSMSGTCHCSIIDLVESMRPIYVFFESIICSCCLQLTAKFSG